MSLRTDMTSVAQPAALVTQIDAILPQTQCTKCGYTGCKPYANAIATGEADINQCPPGGDEGIHKLARLLDRPYKPLNPANGAEKPLALAVIDEAICIGCTLCIKACPVDAILGAAKQMHTIIAAQCTGCELCVAPCPVDCISMETITDASTLQQRHTEQQAFSDASRERFEFRNLRLERDKQEKAERLAARLATPRDEAASPAATQAGENPASEVVDPKKALIAAAMARAKAQREAQASAQTTPPTDRKE
ncbi:electron transport complex subunit RsxB [Uliginosibacterium sp. H3]|uniref:Electron transport complex subunit RsxB n=1 Tax=Uliginosibacterium silvisoli TaxID=3114758 RepID=A0ABU6K5P0_9RHOO|nr:electron transport complex subunit RsxB [Uliginosibacterium sp. H3]